MGGIGSGRRWHYGAKSTTDGYQSIDVRWLKRKDMLSPGAGGRITWSRHGEVVATINIMAADGCLLLIYRHRINGDDWKDESYPVHLVTTPCRMGGERHWFLCPVHGCSRRVAVLYGGSVFACRKCHQLAYPSQREDPGERAARRAHRIRDRMGWSGGVLDGPGSKPKGMHWRTYERLCDEHETFEDVLSRSFIARFGPILNRGR